MAFDSSQQAIVICTILTVVASMIILSTFGISKAWAKEFFDRKHLLFCMTFTLMLFSISVSFVYLHKSEVGCVVQANFIQIFGVATILYAAAVAVDAYFYIMGFSVPVSKTTTVLRDGALSAIPSADRSSDMLTQSSMSDAQLDFYNRDTETNDPATDAIIGLDIQVVASSADRTVSLEVLRQSNAFGIDDVLRDTNITGREVTGIGERPYMAPSLGRSQSFMSNIRSHWKPIARKYRILHLCIFAYILLGLVIFNFFDVAVTYISPGYICYFDEVTFIGYFTIIPIFCSVITIFVSNFGIIRVVLKFYRSGAGENEKDVVTSGTMFEKIYNALNVHAYVSAILEVLRRLDKTGSKELTRVILFPLFYLIAAMMIVVIGIIRRVLDNKSPTSLVVAVCNAILVGVGNCLIWVMSDSDIVQLWMEHLQSNYCDCCAYVACCCCGGELVTEHTDTTAADSRRSVDSEGVMMVAPGVELSSA
jgi:hypothetical protein